MQRFGALILSFLFAAAMNVAVNAQEFGKTEIIKAKVVAQRSFALCIYHPCIASLIVRVDDKKQAKYLRLDVEYFPLQSKPAGGFPVQLVENSKMWKFKAVRRKDRDEPLKESSGVMKNKNVKDTFESVPSIAEDELIVMPVWKLLPAAENEKLPFGEILPNYYVKANKFKLHK
ncbi:MAG: hypothetical protein M3384_00165 [Acidobacteriota bacterium]|nr:hypothetical protein [Acidobacteriota bacterium]